MSIKARYSVTDQDLWLAKGVDEFVAKPCTELQWVEAIQP